MSTNLGLSVALVQTAPGTYNCATSGTLNINLTDNGDGVISAGDKYSANANDCEGSAQTGYNGKAVGGVSATLNSITGKISSTAPYVTVFDATQNGFGLNYFGSNTFTSTASSLLKIARLSGSDISSSINDGALSQLIRPSVGTGSGNRTIVSPALSYRMYFPSGSVLQAKELTGSMQTTGSVYADRTKTLNVKIESPLTSPGAGNFLFKSGSFTAKATDLSAVRTTWTFDSTTGTTITIEVDQDGDGAFEYSTTTTTNAMTFRL